MKEISTDQVYNVEIDGIWEEYTISAIRITNIESNNDFIISITFKNDQAIFDTNVKHVINNPSFTWLRNHPEKVRVVSLFNQCSALTIEKEYQIIARSTKYLGTKREKSFFTIIDDIGKKRTYKTSNSMFYFI